MSKFGTFIKELAQSGFILPIYGVKKLLQGNVGTAIKGAAGLELTPAQTEMNQFNAAQAEINRDWQEQMYLKYNSPSAQVAQMRAAGLNPALMYGSSPTPASTAGGAASGTPVASGLSSLIDSITRVAGVKSQIELNQSLAAKNSADAEEIGQRIHWNPSLFENQLKTGEVNRENMLAGIRKINSEIDLIYAEKAYKDVSSEKVSQEIKNLVKEGTLTDARVASEYIHQGLMAAQELLVKANTDNVNIQTLQRQFEYNMYVRTGVMPGANQWQAMIQALQGVSVSAGEKIDNISSIVSSWLDKPIQTVKSWFGK